MTATVSEIWRYPVKSIGGESIETTMLSALGIDGDRAWGLRDLASGKILSGKSPAVGRLLLPLSAHYKSDGSVRERSATLTIDGEEISADDVDRLSSRFSELLGREVRFERATDADEVYESYWPELPDIALSDVTTDFPIAMFTGKGTLVDLAALHLLSTSSLRKLAELLPDAAITEGRWAGTIDVRRFRPSMVIETEGTDFVENNWAGRTATLGTATLAFGPASPRCVMTTLAHGDLPADKRILQTLATNNKINFEGFGNFACLGVYAEVTTPGVVSVGDELVLL